MRKELRIECQKMIKSRTLAFSILFGVAITLINVVENYTLKRWFLGVPVKMPGYATLSLFTNWIDGSQSTAGEMIFFTVFPLLASFLVAAQRKNERIHKSNPHKVNQDKLSVCKVYRRLSLRRDRYLRSHEPQLCY